MYVHSAVNRFGWQHRQPRRCGSIRKVWHASSAGLAPAEFLDSVGRIFAHIDQQDSGNVSFGVAVAGKRYFVKTAGEPSGSARDRSAHGRRLARLENAERLARSVSHPTLTQFVGSTETAWGRILVYRWADGVNLYAPRHQRTPDSAGQRFRSLPLAVRVAAVRRIIGLHAALASQGWVAGDFYDGCLIYDFKAGTMRVCDLDHYHPGPYRNTVGRMPGSTRFMAPEEFEKGRLIDERTTVFALGRTARLFLGDSVRALTGIACAPDPAARYPSVATLADAFGAAAPA